MSKRPTGEIPHQALTTEQLRTESYTVFTLPGGQTLSAQGNGKDLQIVLRNSRYSWKDESVFLWPIDETFLKQEQKKVKQTVNSLIRALGRVSTEWNHDYSLEEILNVAWDPQIEIPNKRRKGWTAENDRHWIEEIMSGIHLRRDNDLWDFEGHRQDGEDFFDEWKNSTDELRH